MHTNREDNRNISVRPLVPLSPSEQLADIFSRTSTKFIIGAIIASSIIGYFFASNSHKVKQPTSFVSSSPATTFSSTTTKPLIKVFVSGSVNNPGVVSIESGSRVDDAIQAAGGIKDVDISQCNLAAFVNDGETIRIPKSCQGAISQSQSINSPQGQDGISDAQGNKTGKININIASQTELESLPGVGPTIAKSIINYRTQKGKFASVNDLRKVKGIGDKKFADLKDLIIV